MLARLKLFVARLEAGKAPRSAPRDELATAVAVLLARAATLDGRMDADERLVMVERLSARFGVAKDDMDQVLDDAVSAADRMVDLYGLIRTVKEHMDEEGRIELMEALWEVVYSDGDLHEYEAQLMRRMAGLLYVSDRDSGEARKRALVKVGLDAG